MEVVMNRLTKTILLICMLGTLSGLSAGMEEPLENINWLLDRYINEPAFAQNWPTDNDFYSVLVTTAQIQEKCNAHRPTPEIQSMVDSALRAARITKPIIVLERSLHGHSCVATTEGLQYLIVDTGGGITPNQLTGVIYHEVGHIAHEDGLLDANWPVSQNKVSTALRLINMLLLPKTIVSGAIQILSGQYIEKFMQRRAEKRADEFACKLLVETGQIHAALDLAVYLKLQESRFVEKSFIISAVRPFLSTHPSGDDRAQNIVRIAKEYAIDKDAVERLYNKTLYKNASPIEKNQMLMLGMLHLKKPYTQSRFNK
jgi:Zn-dependent protease with chaperone function